MGKSTEIFWDLDLIFPKSSPGNLKIDLLPLPKLTRSRPHICRDGPGYSYRSPQIPDVLEPNQLDCTKFFEARPVGQHSRILKIYSPAISLQ